jgi:hypothetical protein
LFNLTVTFGSEISNLAKNVFFILLVAVWVVIYFTTEIHLRITLYHWSSNLFIDKIIDNQEHGVFSWVENDEVPLRLFI